MSAPTGSLTNWYDGVGNRTNRTGRLGNFGALSSTFDVNDWMDNLKQCIHHAGHDA